jgi:hypothetical protein
MLRCVDGRVDGQHVLPASGMRFGKSGAATDSPCRDRPFQALIDAHGSRSPVCIGGLKTVRSRSSASGPPADATAA